MRRIPNALPLYPTVQEGLQPYADGSASARRNHARHPLRDGHVRRCAQKLRFARRRRRAAAQAALPSVSRACNCRAVPRLPSTSVDIRRQQTLPLRAAQKNIVRTTQHHGLDRLCAGAGPGASCKLCLDARAVGLARLNQFHEAGAGHGHGVAAHSGPSGCGICPARRVMAVAMTSTEPLRGRKAMRA